VCALPAAISIAADYSRHDKRGRALFWLSLGVMAGAALAFTAGGKLFGALSAGGGPQLLRQFAAWRGVHVAFAVAAGGVMLALFLIREPARHELGEAAGLGFRAALHAIWVRRALLLPLFVGQVTAVMADTAAGIWAAPVLSRNYGQRPQDFAGWMGLVILGAGVIGSIVGAYTADAGHKSRIGGGILLSAVVAAAVAIPAAFYPVMPGVSGFAWMLLVFLICGSIAGLVTATAIAVLVPNELRGMCLGAFVVIAGIIGFGVAPTLVSSLSTALGGERALGAALGWTGAGASLIGLGGFALAFLAIRRGAIAEPRHD
jgi:MFS family permease